MSRAIKAGQAYIELALQGRDRVAASLKKLVGTMKSFAIGAAQVGAAGLASVTALGTTLALNAAKAGDELHKMSIRTGISVETLSQMRHATELSGTSMKTFEAGIRGMQRTLLNASQGSSQAAATLQSLGLTYEQLEGLSPEQQFLMLSQAIASVQDPSQRAALAMQLFGRSGQELVPLLSAGRDGITAMMAEADALGRTMSGEQAEAAASFTDQLARVKAILAGLAEQIGGALLPVITDWLTELQAAIAVVSGLGGETDAAGQAAESLGSALQAMGSPIELVVRAGSALGAVFRTIQAGISAALAALAKFVSFAASAAETLPGILGETATGVRELADAIAADMDALASDQWDAAKDNFENAFGDNLVRQIKAEKTKLEKARDTRVANPIEEAQLETTQRAEESLAKAAGSLEAAAQAVDPTALTGAAAAKQFLDNQAANREREMIKLLAAIKNAMGRLGTVGVV